MSFGGISPWSFLAGKFWFALVMADDKKKRRRRSRGTGHSYKFPTG